MKIIKTLVLLLLLFLVTGCAEENSHVFVDITGTWQIHSAENVADGSNYSLQWLYGSGIEYGGAFRFYEDGTFSRFVGAMAELDNYIGTYSIHGNEITLMFNNGRISTARFLPEKQMI